MTLEAMQAVLIRWGMDCVEIIAPAATRSDLPAYSSDLEAAILSTIRRRPCTAPGLAEALGTHANEINKYLGGLEEDGRIYREEQEGQTFYRAPS